MIGPGRTLFVPPSDDPQVVWPALPDGRNATAVAVVQQLEAAAYADAGVRRRAQGRQVARLIDYARAHTAYYAASFPEIEVPADIDELDAFVKELPRLQRRTLQEEGAALLATDPPAAHGARADITTSGATGRPVRVAVNALTNFLWQCHTAWEHLWHDRDLAGRLATIKYTPSGRADPPGERSPSWGAAQQLLGGSGPAFLLTSRTPVEEQAAWLVEHAPSYLLTYPSNLDALADVFSRSGATLPSLRQARTLGEVLSERTRAKVHTVFGCETADMYSAQETGYLALQCRARNYHVCEGNVMLEILDDEGRPCPPGETGRVVVTSLHNFTMPLIRYELGDFATVGADCPCGRTLPVLQRIAGRVRNMLVLPDGRRVWPTYNPMALARLFPRAQFQLVQTDLTAIEVRIAGERLPSGPLRERAAGIIRDALGHDYTLRFVESREPDRTAGGKYEEFRCDIDLP